MEKEFQKRKPVRWEKRDYSDAGRYFITVCAQGRKPIFSRPTLMDVVCAFKSLATKRCKEISPIEKVFQTSFFEHIIRDGEDYKNHVRYIFENPLKWREDELYAE